MMVSLDSITICIFSTILIPHPDSSRVRHHMADSGFPASYRPDLPPETIFAEHTWLQGAFLGAVAYGIQFVLYVVTCFFLWRLRTPSTKRMNIIFIIYISIIFILSTLYIVGLFQFTQLSFIDGRNIPGGPQAFESMMFSLPIDMLANVIMVLNSWFCDIINVGVKGSLNIFCWRNNRYGGVGLFTSAAVYHLGLWIQYQCYSTWVL